MVNILPLNMVHQNKLAKVAKCQNSLKCVIIINLMHTLLVRKHNDIDIQYTDMKNVHVFFLSVYK